MIPWSSSTNEAGTPSVWSAKLPTMNPAKRKATKSVPKKLAPASAAMTIAMKPYPGLIPWRRRPKLMETSTMPAMPAIAPAVSMTTSTLRAVDIPSPLAAPGPRDKPGHREDGHVVQEERGDDLVHAPERARDRGQRGPERAREHRGADHRGEEGAGRPGREREGGGARADRARVQLPFGADVPEAHAEADGDGEPGQREGDRLQQRLSHGELVSERALEQRLERVPGRLADAGEDEGGGDEADAHGGEPDRRRGGGRPDAPHAALPAMSRPNRSTSARAAGKIPVIVP